MEKLLKMLLSNKASERYDACEWIRISQESSPEIVTALVKATHDADKEVAERATMALHSDVHHQMMIKMGMIESDKTEENENIQAEKTNNENVMKKNSALGIASFIIGIIVSIFVITYMLFPHGPIYEFYFKLILIGLIDWRGAIYLPLLLSLVSLGLGIMGCIEDRKNIYAILGIFFSVPSICISGLWFIYSTFIYY